MVSAALALGAGALAVMSAAHPGASTTHPLHTTLTSLTYDSAARQLTAEMRTFASDFSAAVARRGGHKPPADDRVSDSASFAYVASAITIADRDGRPMKLEWCGSRRTGDVLWLCVRAPAPRGAAGMQVGNRALSELFDDQVNIVMADYDGRKESMLFTKGDGPKPLP
jgi:hypothetical protein